jgi:hypothetical protein
MISHRLPQLIELATLEMSWEKPKAKTCGENEGSFDAINAKRVLAYFRLPYSLELS